jgi:hypothetical protein
VGTHAKTKHKPATISPAVPPGWISGKDTDVPLGDVLATAAASLPSGQPKTLDDLLHGPLDHDGDDPAGQA